MDVEKQIVSDTRNTVAYGLGNVKNKSVFLGKMIFEEIQKLMSTQKNQSVPMETLLTSVVLGALQGGRDAGISDVDIAGKTARGLSAGLRRLNGRRNGMPGEVASITMEVTGLEATDLERLSVSILEGTLLAFKDSDIDLDQTVSQAVEGICDTAGTLDQEATETVQEALLSRPTLPRHKIQNALHGNGRGPP